MSKAVTYHIIGAGAAGLYCARLLKEQNQLNRTIIYEASGKAGGRCYSYDDKDLNMRLDNATHVIVGGNKLAAKLMAPQKWNKSCWFWDVKADEFTAEYKKYRAEILRAMCNTATPEIAQPIIKNIFWQLFPWGPKQRQIYFSAQDLTQRFINPLLAYADEIHLNSRLVKLDTQIGRIAQLTFNNQEVEIGANDKIILALDAHNAAQLLGLPQFEFNNIINIFYKTSQRINLPKQTSFAGVAGGLCDWIFCYDKMVAVTISNAGNVGDIEQLARQIWHQLDTLRGVNSAFVPSFKALNHKYATIKQDAANNDKRPPNACTTYPNLFIAGDWTMKNRPCCIETALQSAVRAVKAATKN